MEWWSTYRVQLRAGFDFDDAAGVADYLAELGVTHMYCSPYLQAAPGSTHGYDVVDPTRFNEELGGAHGHAELAAALRRRGLGQVLDIVPNHMATHESNRWWWDVLKRGAASRYARFFDLDWDSGESKSDFKVLVPVLADSYRRVLEAGGLRIERLGDEFVLRYEDRRLPVSPESLAALDAGVAAVNGKPGLLDDFLSRQHYRLAHWRMANEELNYRRFFDIDTLAGVRIEDSEVFDQTHALILQLVADGVVEGLRVDHIDGLRDPEGYLTNLAHRTGGVYTVVEKILETAESLPDTWPVSGTSGYDFLARVNNLFVVPDHEEAMTATYVGFSGEAGDYDQVVRDSKQRVMRHELVAEVERVTGLLAVVCARHRRHRDHTRPELRDCLRELVTDFPVYRTYLRPGRSATDAHRRHVARAVAKTLERRPDLDRELVAFVGELALGTLPGPLEQELALRLPQLTVPVMAKGVEDTAFYRYHRLVSLNEVGGDPRVFGRSAADFHRDTAFWAERWPESMLTLSTHDTKRSADVRARLHVLSELPDDWQRVVERWANINDAHRRDAWPDRNAEYLLYQSLVGAWPIDADRLAAFMAKATKEAKVHTSWTDPVDAYDQAVDHFTRSMLADGEFVKEVRDFLARHRIVERGRRNSLAQTALLLTCPGVADIYQGSELWDLSLVDPDNRRPVDYSVRRQLLRDLAAGGADHLDDLSARIDDGSDPGRPKLRLIHQVLSHRRRDPDSYGSTMYEPLRLHGRRVDDAVGFTRPALAVVVPRRGDGRWDGTSVDLPRGSWTDVVTGTTVDGGRQPLSALFGSFPVAVLTRMPA